MSDTTILIITSIGTSIVAAIIFWLFFNYLPDRSRHNKTRPKLELDIYELYSTLFFYLQIPFKINKHSASSVQHLIFAGRITFEDFRIRLSTRCLNESYHIDEASKLLLTAGEELTSSVGKMNQLIQKVYVFNQYLTTDEIILLKHIENEINRYSLDSNAITQIGKELLHPVDPTISYMATSFNNLYLLYQDLQEIIFKYRYIDKVTKNQLIKTRIANLYYCDEYAKCIKAITKYNNKELSFDDYRYMVSFKLEKKAIALKYLSKLLLTNSLELVYLRSTFVDSYLDDEIKAALIEIRTKKEYEVMQDCIEQEKMIEDAMIKAAQHLRELYDNKLKNVQPPL